MKKFVTWALFLFVIVVAGIFLGAIFIKPKNIVRPLATSGPKVENVTIPRTALKNNVEVPAPPIPKSGFSLQEVSVHNSQNDCWLIINNKVYDVSGFLDSHPGGAETIIPYCGKEATQAFDTKDKSRPRNHSADAQTLLNDYYIGDFIQ